MMEALEMACVEVEAALLEASWTVLAADKRSIVLFGLNNWMLLFGCASSCVVEAVFGLFVRGKSSAFFFWDFFLVTFFASLFIRQRSRV
jgi:hypothetical protein